MKVHAVTYAATSDAPKGCEAIARLRLSDGSWHPVVVHAATPEAAGEKALAWWSDEVARVRARREAAEARMAARRQARVTATPNPEA